MRSAPLTRREFLAATAGAGISLHVVAAAQSTDTRHRGSPVVPLIPRRTLFDSPERSLVRISPDGTLMAFLAPVSGVLNLWVAPVRDAGKGYPVTRGTDWRLGPWLVWPHDNRHVVFFRERGGDENWQAYRVDLQAGGIRPLTPGPGVTSYVQEISHHFPGELLIGHNQRDPHLFDLYRINAATGESTLVQVNDGFPSYLTDPLFRVRLAVRYTDDGDVEYLQRTANGEWALFTRVDSGDVATTRPIGFNEDGRELYWLDSRGRDKAAVVAQDIATGALRVLAEDAQADFVRVVRAPLSRRPIAAESFSARRHWRVVDSGYAADHVRLSQLSAGDIVDVSTSDDTNNWVVLYERDVGPGQFFHYDRSAKRGRFLFSSRSTLEKAPLVRMEPQIIHARDGLPLVCYLSRPPGADRAAPQPMILLVHGGPWGRDTWGFSPTHQWLANRGYTVLSVNFRGSTGFGKAFINAANLEWGGRMHDDLIDATDWAIARGIADPKRIAIYGASYGGYAALVALTLTPEKFACAVDLYGISDLITFLDALPQYWKSAQKLLRVRVGDRTTEAGQRFLRERSPLHRVDRIVRPLLIGQGANDVRVKPSQSEQIVGALERRGIPVTYVYYPDEGHGFSRPENRRSFAAVAELFLARHLGGRYEPVGDAFKGSTIEFKAGGNLLTSSS